MADVPEGAGGPFLRPRELEKNQNHGPAYLQYGICVITEIVVHGNLKQAIANFPVHVMMFAYRQVYIFRIIIGIYRWRCSLRRVGLPGSSGCSATLVPAAACPVRPPCLSVDRNIHYSVAAYFPSPKLADHNKLSSIYCILLNVFFFVMS